LPSGGDQQFDFCGKVADEKRLARYEATYNQLQEKLAKQRD